jgi:hypothetical protein
VVGTVGDVLHVSFCSRVGDVVGSVGVVRHVAYCSVNREEGLSVELHHVEGSVFKRGTKLEVSTEKSNPLLNEVEIEGTILILKYPSLTGEQ